jgi:hypothetical protein
LAQKEEEDGRPGFILKNGVVDWAHRNKRAEDMNLVGVVQWPLPASDNFNMLGEGERKSPQNGSSAGRGSRKGTLFEHFSCY